MLKRVISTPAGDMLIGVQDGRLCAVHPLAQRESIPDVSDPVLDEAQRQIADYFAGARQTFDLPLYMQGTIFEQTVWRQLLQIPFGQIRTYGQIAAALGKPKAARAVGSACSRNPLLLVVPCHRVIGVSGKLTGFAAGLAAKERLLVREGWNVEFGKIQGKETGLPD